MSSPLEEPDQRAQLLIGLIDTELTSDELVALRQDLRQEDGVDAYVDYISLHALLEWRFGMPPLTEGESSAMPTRAAAPLPVSPLLGFLSGAWNLIQGSPRTLLMIVAGLLAGYFVTVMALVPMARRAERDRLDRAEVARGRSSHAPPGTDVGALSADEQVRWSADSSQAKKGRLRAGECYWLVDGRVEMALAGGVRVWVDGPAEFEPQSGERIRLQRGKLSAQVPPAGRGFTVATPLAEVIDLGTEFGVEVDTSGKTDVHVLRGEVEVKQAAAPSGTGPAAATGATTVRAGQAVRVSAAGARPVRIPVDRAAFANAPQAAATAAPADRLSDERVTKIWLGNLFDDRPHVSLADAMRTDTFGAEADLNDLGVSTVVHGGAALAEIAPGILFDFTSVGWQDQTAFRVANDCVGVPHLGLRVTGKGGGIESTKREDGIGMHANSLVTFSLPEIRRAWKQPRRSLKFVCDAAGVNDSMVNALAPGSSLHLVAIVSSRTKPLAAMVDGAVAPLGQHDGHAFVQLPVGPPQRADGKSFRVDEVLDPEAEYLTLVCTSAGDGYHADHGAWVGARLELAP